MKRGWKGSVGGWGREGGDCGGMEREGGCRNGRWRGKEVEREGIVGGWGGRSKRERGGCSR